VRLRQVRDDAPEPDRDPPGGLVALEYEMQADQVDRDGLDRAPLRASWMLDGVRVDGQAVALGEVQRPVLAGQQLPIERPAGRDAPM
jgi:hypothetical protein